ncbi:hypothetical protein DFS33DRAFT_1298434 [Desarmillaria ectypa]|nr:hypothetical protein DFS33DRAFT_1298434 [Desarmillaria ectypa]
MNLFPKYELQPIKVDEDGAWNFFDGALKTYFIGADGTGNFTSRQVFKHSNPHTGAGRESTATPPYHWHIYQTETFDVKSGVLCYDLDGTQGKLQAGESVTITPGRYHTFWSDPEAGKDLDVHITVSGGPNPGFDETFVHNFYGYLSSVTTQGLKPSIFQMLAFMDHADVVLVDFPFQSGRLANLVLGRWIGRYIGGYDVEYKIFSEKAT